MTRAGRTRSPPPRRPAVPVAWGAGRRPLLAAGGAEEVRRQERLHFDAAVAGLDLGPVEDVERGPARP